MNYKPKTWSARIIASKEIHAEGYTSKVILLLINRRGKRALVSQESLRVFSDGPRWLPVLSRLTGEDVPPEACQSVVDSILADGIPAPMDAESFRDLTKKLSRGEVGYWTLDAD